MQETDFTPWASLAGGALIGLAAVLLMAANGRIAGVSGIISRLLPPAAESAQRLTGIAFVVGLLLAAPLSRALTGQWAAQSVSTDLLTLLLGGLLVGFGSVLGNGCTSGHGVCGISRFSMRSIVATMTFMATAFVTVYISRHILAGV